MALSSNEEWVEGIYSLHTNHQTRWDRIMKLGQTDLVQNVNVRIFGGTDMSIR